jgi:hypothetical protein
MRCMAQEAERKPKGKFVRKQTMSVRGAGRQVVGEGGPSERRRDDERYVV